MTTSARDQLRTAGWFSSGAAGNAAGFPALLASVLLAGAVSGLWLLTHPYEGVIHDARLYVGHVLAAADPQGVGQDMMFRKDGQFGLTLFPMLLATTIDAVGVSLGAKLLSLAGLLLWIAALGALAASVAEGRLRWVIVLFVVVLPSSYGAFDVFNYAEPIATPRVFAEAGVLFSFALLCRRRLLWALPPIFASVLLHPIMALPALGVWAWFAFFDPRARIFPLNAGVVIAAVGLSLVPLAAALNVPLVERLFIGIDPAFHDVLSARARHLFPSFWPLGDWSRFFVQAVTLAIAAAAVTGRVRALFVGALVVGVGGVAASLVLGDALNSLLAVQVQLWRAAWIVAVLAAAGLAICAVTLWRKGGRAQLALGFLAVAWLGADQPVIGVSGALLATVFAFAPSLDRLKFTPQLILGLWSFVLLYAVLRQGMSVYALTLFLDSRPEGGTSIVLLLGSLGLWTIPVCVLAAAWGLDKGSGPLPLPLAAVLGAAFVALGFTYWDARSPRTIADDGADGDPALKALLSARKGEVLWLDGGFETWSLAGRPNWISVMQGAGAVFSRSLAMDWDRRVGLLIDLGLADERARDVFTDAGRTSSAPARLMDLTDARLKRLCARTDAPAWLIAPASTEANSELSPSPWTSSSWEAPGAAHTFEWKNGSVEWTSTEHYVVISCAS